MPTSGNGYVSSDAYYYQSLTTVNSWNQGGAFDFMFASDIATALGWSFLQTAFTSSQKLPSARQPLRTRGLSLSLLLALLTMVARPQLQKP